MNQTQTVTFENPSSLSCRIDSINMFITTTMIHDTKNIKRLGIHTYYEDKKHSVTPYSTDNGDIVLFFLGRLFFQDEVDHEVTTEEYIVDIYKKYGFHYLLKKLHGVFTFILLDQSYQKEESVMYVVTDPFGLVPMYYHESNTNTIHFSTTESLSNSISVPAASYCKLFYTNKVSSIWSFDKEESTPSYNREIKQWIYPPRKFRYYKYRMFHGGQYPFDIDYIENTDRNVHLYLYDSIITSIEHTLYRAFQLRLYHFEQYDIYCVGNPYDIEFLFMKKMLTKILDSGNSTVKPLFHTIYVDSLQDKESQDYLELMLKVSAAASNQQTEERPIIIFASSGFITAEGECERDRESDSKTLHEQVLNYDAKLYNILDTIVPNTLLPNIVEPLKKRGILVEFPFLEEQWLRFYFTILPRIRYQHPLHMMLSDRVPLEI